jgi:nitrogen fixation NifU-like protein
MADRLVRELLADHSRNPRNDEPLPDPDVEWGTDNPQCVGPTHPEGDQVTVAATLSDDTPPVVERVRFTLSPVLPSPARTLSRSRRLHR